MFTNKYIFAASSKTIMLGLFIFFTILRLAYGSDFALKCHAIPNSLFSRWTAPLAHLVSQFLHSECGYHGSQIDDKSIHIATWPQYGNFTFTDGGMKTCASVEGFAYAIPRCASFQGRRRILSDLMSLVGYEMGDLLSYSMPFGWRTFSVVGGQPMLGFVDNSAPPAELGTRTNKFGHFHDFYGSTNNSISKKQLGVRNQSMIDLDQRLSIVGCNKFDGRSRRATLDMHYFPPEGLTIVSDVDDILRVAEIWNPKQMIFNTFVRSFRPWLDMNRVYRD
jgi:hypothetical protein